MPVSDVPGKTVRNFPLLLALIVLAASLLRAPFLFRGLWYDEAVSLLLFIDPGPRAILLEPRFAFTNHALYSWCAWLCREVLGRNEGALRLPAYLAGLATVLLAGLLFRRRLGDPAALLFSLFLALSPLAIHYSLEGRGYGFVMLFSLLLLSSSWNFFATGGTRPAWEAGLVSLAGLLTHQQFLVPVLALLATIALFSPAGPAGPRSGRIRHLLPLGLALLTAALYLSLRFPLWETARDFATGRTTTNVYVSMLRDHTRAFFSSPFTSRWLEEFALRLGWESRLLTVLFFLGGTAFLCSRLIPPWLRFLVFLQLALSLLPGLLTGQASILWRYFLFLSIPCQLAAAAGLPVLKRGLAARHPPAGSAFALLTAILLAYAAVTAYPPSRLPYLRTSYLGTRDALQFITREGVPGRLLLHCTPYHIVNDSQLVWQYYLGDRYEEEGMTALSRRTGPTELWYVSEGDFPRLEQDPKFPLLPDTGSWKRVAAFTEQTVFRGRLDLTPATLERYRVRIEVVALFLQGIDRMQQRQYEEAEQCHLRALALLRATPLPFPRERLLNNLGVLAIYRRQDAEARSRFQEALAANPSCLAVRHNLLNFSLSSPGSPDRLRINVLCLGPAAFFSDQEILEKSEVRERLGRTAGPPPLLVFWHASAPF